MSTHNLCFEQNYERYQIFLSKNFQFLMVNFSMYLNRRVFFMQMILLADSECPDQTCSGHAFFTNLLEIQFIIIRRKYLLLELNNYFLLNAIPPRQKRIKQNMKKKSFFMICNI